jgi:hypothetical protein
MLSLRSAAKSIILWDPFSKVISTRNLAQKVSLQQPISLRRLIELSTWIRLKFVMQHQQQTNWCWSAVAVSVCKFFNPDCSWTQCSLVNAEFERSDCCNNGSSSYCNTIWYLDRVLSRTGNLRSWSSGTASIDNIIEEINSSHPICVRIGWPGGGGHFVAIGGYYSLLRMVAVEDPWYGSSTIHLDTFISSYKGSGMWTHTYYVEP